jgi:hypothetical protein
MQGVLEQRARDGGLFKSLFDAAAGSSSERMVLETCEVERTVVSSVLDSPMYTGIITITSRYLLNHLAALGTSPFFPFKSIKYL